MTVNSRFIIGDRGFRAVNMWCITSGLIIPATIVSIGVALLFMRTNYRFRRREGAMLISLYLVFLVLLALQRNGIILAT